MLPLVTATPERSIWNGLDKSQFERNVGRFPTKKPVYRAKSYSGDDWPVKRSTENSKDWLPLAVERQLVDDLAFIASCEHGSLHVTAVCAEYDDRNGVLTILLAVNDKIEPHVVDGLNEIFRILERCATKSRSISTLSVDVTTSTYLVLN
jgi:hypothetical protein